MTLFIIVGIIALVTGIFFILAPEELRSLNEMSSKLIADLEQKAFDYRIGVGLSFIIASLLFFFVAYYIHIKG